MTKLKLCGTVLAALTISAVPGLAEDNPEREGRPRLVFVQVEDDSSATTNVLVEVRRRAAARLCGDDFSRSARVACTISEEEARQAGLLGDDNDNDDNDNDNDNDNDEYVDANHGHGNDPDGFDEDNPGHGNSKGGKGNDNRSGNH